MAANPLHPVLVGLLGGECTGKTTVALHLVGALPRAVAVPEALRRFVVDRGRPPLSDEQAGIMNEQRAGEEIALASGAAVVIGDPATLMTAVYSQIYFADESLMQQARLDAERYGLLLWCAPDIPWQADGVQRDGEAARARAEAAIGRILADFRKPAVRLEGDVAMRVSRAEAAVRALL